MNASAKLLAGIAFCGAALFTTTAAAREWKDRSGKFSIEAELAGIEGDSVRLKKPDGQTVLVPLSRLCEKDRQFVKSQDSGGDKAKSQEAPPAAKKTTAASGNSNKQTEAPLRHPARVYRLGSCRPATGTAVAGMEGLDEAIDSFMSEIGAKAATLAVADNGRLLFCRGYGYADKEERQPTQPEHIMRIASCSKPFTAALVKGLLRAGKLRPDLRVCPYLAIRPREGSIADARLQSITVSQLLEHKGGFDREQSFDPMFAMKKIETALKLEGPPSARDVVEYMMTQPLQFNPGERTAYSNFGYCVLGRVVEKATGASYVEAVQRGISRPLGIRDLILSRTKASERDPREVWYPVADDEFRVEVMDAHGGLATSVASLCRFMQSYWIGGDPRGPMPQQFHYNFFGSLPGTTALIKQREDGIHYAVLLNNRRNAQFQQDNERLEKSLDAAIDAIKMRLR
jgi:CubicO group peptidase (beta-lactamase class C family)